MKNLCCLISCLIMLVLTSCKLTIDSFTGPFCFLTNDEISVRIAGYSEGTECDITVYGLVLQIPVEWEILEATATWAGILQRNLEYESLYFPEENCKIWVGTGSETDCDDYDVQVIVKIRTGKTTGNFTLKAAAGALKSDVWRTQDPAGEFRFANIHDDRYLHEITLEEPVFSIPTPDTGQTTCYDNSTEIECPQSGTPFFGQDASYTINSPSYSKMDENGAILTDSAASWAMIKDNVTGLIWEKKTNDGSIHDKDNVYSGYDSYYGDGLISNLNSNQFGGYSDWRLPKINELLSIVNWAQTNPAISGIFFSNMQPAFYWSFTLDAGNAGYALGVNFENGNIETARMANNYYVLAVRGKQIQKSGNFVDNKDYTVTDTSAGLMWQKGTESCILNLEDALSKCENSSLAGYDDWRLPAVKEFHSVVDYTSIDPSIDTEYFLETELAHYWSSTTRTSEPTNESTIYFSDGLDYSRSKANQYCVRCVRGGQNIISDHLKIFCPTQASRWKVGNPMSMEWDTKTISGNVKISISREGGKNSSFETVIATTENDGFYEWNVTGPASVNCVIKIEPLNDTSKQTSQGLITIYDFPMVNTAPISSITNSSALSGGNISSNGGLSVTQKGVCWSISPNPTVALSTKTNEGSGSDSFVCSVTGLDSGTAYHLRAYATNSAGTGYGDDISFTTSFSSTLYVDADGQCGQEPCYETIQLALEAAENGSLIKVDADTFLETPNWKKAGTVTISGGWNSSFSEHNGVSEIYNPLASGGGTVKLQPNFKVVSQ